MPVRPEDLGEPRERVPVVLDVLEDVEADDGVDRLGRKVAGVVAGEGKTERSDPDVRAPVVLAPELLDVVGLDVGRRS